MSHNKPPAPDSAAPRVVSSRQENLALLYQGLLTGIVRLQARRQHLNDSDAFRRRMKAALADVERDAAATGYSSQDIQDSAFAIVTFLDEVILTSDEPARQQWAKKTLGVELFGDAKAGEVFFEKLEALRGRRDSPQLADVLEVYLLCLLLGYEGRFSASHGDLHAVTERVRKRIDLIRESDPRLSPQPLPEQPTSPAPVPTSGRSRRWTPMAAVALIAASLLCFLIFKLQLVWQVSRLQLEN